MARKTNVQIVKGIMEFSKHGVIAQAFVMEAIGRYAEEVAKATPEQLAPMDSGMIHSSVWQETAKEILHKLQLEGYRI
jgi:hypothetical protein